MHHARRTVIVMMTSVSLVAGVAVSAAPSAAATPKWSVATFPNPAGSTSVDFEGVTCPSAKSCFAVGFAQTGKVNKTLVEHWNGSKWSVMATPNPAGATNAYLQAVSCATTTNCVAVGYSTQGATTKSLAEHWTGTTWSVIDTPSPVTWTNPSLESVSCASPTSCMAIGHGRAITGESIVEHWDGSAWSVVPIAKLVSWTETSFYGVSCPSTTSCFAVGFFQDIAFAPLRTLVEHWDGAAWSIQASPSPTGAKPAGLSRVSCPSVTSCFAVGSYSKGGGFKTLAMRGNGATWSTTATPNPQSTGSFLNDVSCANPTSCVAVGHAIGRTLAERWTGSAWSISTTPNPAASTDSWLKSVACPAPASCIGVGTIRIKNVTKGLIERFA